MRRQYLLLAFAAAATATTLVLCLAHIFRVREPLTFFDYFVLDIAFLPVQVILVSVIVERMLHAREKAAMLKKLNMVVGAFFSEVGSDLLRRLAPFCRGFEDLSSRMAVDGNWTEADYRRAAEYWRSRELSLETGPLDIAELRDFLRSRQGFVLGLLQNPNLLEHESFTDLLWAITHLEEELVFREEFEDLPEPDLMHLRGDVERAFRLLVREWLGYMRHLSGEYPYIHSLSVRTNPFKKEPEPVISES